MEKFFIDGMEKFYIVGFLSLLLLILTHTPLFADPVKHNNKIIAVNCPLGFHAQINNKNQWICVDPKGLKVPRVPIITKPGEKPDIKEPYTVIYARRSA